MLANVTHELKTPLNSILAIVSLMILETHEKSSLKNLKKIKTSSELMLSLINDIIDNAKLDAGSLGLQNEEFDLQSLFDELTDLFEI